MKLPIAALGFVLGSAFFFLAGSVYSQEPSSQSAIFPTPERLRTLGQQPDDGPVIMLNLLIDLFGRSARGSAPAQRPGSLGTQ